MKILTSLHESSGVLIDSRAWSVRDCEEVKGYRGEVDGGISVHMTVTGDLQRSRWRYDEWRRLWRIATVGTFYGDQQGSRRSSPLAQFSRVCACQTLDLSNQIGRLLRSCKFVFNFWWRITHPSILASATAFDGMTVLKGFLRWGGSAIGAWWFECGQMDFDSATVNRVLASTATPWWDLISDFCSPIMKMLYIFNHHNHNLIRDDGESGRQSRCRWRWHPQLDSAVIGQKFQWC